MWQGVCKPWNQSSAKSDRTSHKDGKYSHKSNKVCHLDILKHFPSLNLLERAKERNSLFDWIMLLDI